MGMLANGARGSSMPRLECHRRHSASDLISIANTGIFFSTRERRMVQPMKIDCSSCNNQREVTEA
jgi:hypothetical protein